MFSPGIPELLHDLKCSIAISTYQAGRLIFISSMGKNSMVNLYRPFARPMGIAEDRLKDKLALAVKGHVIVFANSSELAKYYPKDKGKYDAMYMPRNTFYVGKIDIHDLNYGKDERLFAVNTLFSCIVEINSDFSFAPYWRPQFIKDYEPMDLCHLNGMAMKDGLPKYATAFNKGGNKFQSWRDDITNTGIVIDIETHKIIAEGLSMPHSPRIYNNELYVLLSGTGELIKIDPESGNHEVIIKTDSFIRGMSFHKDYLFIGISKLRDSSTTFGKLKDINEDADAGVLIIHLPTRKIFGRITYPELIEEIYDVHILAGKLRPNILNTDEEDYKSGLMIPNKTFWSKIKTE